MNKNIVNGFKYKHVYIYTVYIAHKDRETKKQIIIHSWRMPVNQTLVAQNGKVSACDAGDRVRSWVWKLPWKDSQSSGVSASASVLPMSIQG